MTHPYITQLRFARVEFERCLDGLSAQDAVKRLEPMNCISWMVGHLASQEHYMWVMRAQGRNIAPHLVELVGTGKPASTPPFDEMWALWGQITAAADPYLDGLTDGDLRTILVYQGKPAYEDVGAMLLRNIYHYWFHIGEAHAVRQILGHPDLPQFVGNMSAVRHSAGE